MAHALLSPSSAARWLACTPSARLEAKYPDTRSEAAAEGTLAHTLAELLLRKELGLVKPAKFKQAFEMIQQDGRYTPAMLEHCESYRDYVLERFEEAKGHSVHPIIFLEERLDLTQYAPESFGTGDAFIVADHTMYGFDLKYGKGVPVGVESNKQMMLYALGALVKFGFLYEIEKVNMTIYQPRLDNIASVEMDVADLLKWAEEELRPKAALAFEGKGEFKAGAHCKFCKAAPTCRALMEYNMEIAKYEFEKPEELSDHEIADILRRADSFKNWIGVVESYALAQAIEKEKEWPGFKLVEGRSVRVITSQEEAIERLRKEGLKDDEIFNTKLKGITELEKLLGKGHFSKVLEGIIEKPEGKPTLVEENDKRPALDRTTSAIKDFQ